METGGHSMVNDWVQNPAGSTPDSLPKSIKIGDLIIEPGRYLASRDNQFIYIKSISAEKDFGYNFIHYYWLINGEAYVRPADHFKNTFKWQDAPFRNVTEEESNYLTIKEVIE